MEKYSSADVVSEAAFVMLSELVLHLADRAIIDPTSFANGLLHMADQRNKQGASEDNTRSALDNRVAELLRSKARTLLDYRRPRTKH